MDKKNILIISGGSIDYNWAANWLEKKSYDYIIAADKGLMHADHLKLKVNYILGDYDSVDHTVLEKYRNSTETVTYPEEKDYTDTHIALLKAFEQEPDQIDMIGVTGTRYDHAMTNIFLLKQALMKHVNCCIYDPNNKIYMKDQTFSISKYHQYGDYISFVPVTEQVMISLKGMKYPLDRYHLVQGLSICQSNQIMEDYAEVILNQGIILAIESRD